MTDFQRITVDDIRLDQTCGACPEQYDAYVGSEVVGYLRLRHGYFRVECPDSGGDTVYSAHPDGDGIFEAEEREGFLHYAKMAIATWVNERRRSEASDAHQDVVAENERLRAENERLERALDSIASYAWRPDPPNAHKPFTSAERLSSIRFHPEIRNRSKETTNG